MCMQTCLPNEPSREPPSHHTRPPQLWSSHIPSGASKPKILAQPAPSRRGAKLPHKPDNIPCLCLGHRIPLYLTPGSPHDLTPPPFLELRKAPWLSRGLRGSPMPFRTPTYPLNHILNVPRSYMLQITMSHIPLIYMFIHSLIQHTKGVLPFVRCLVSYDVATPPGLGPLGRASYKCKKSSSSAKQTRMP